MSRAAKIALIGTGLLALGLLLLSITALSGHIDTVAACQSGDVLKLRDVEVALVQHSLTVTKNYYAGHTALIALAKHEAAYEIAQLRSVHC